MCPSTEGTDQDGQFAVEVLQKLLQRIESANKESGRGQYAVTHAWTDGPMMFVVYTAPPSDRTWGLARDTRQSLVDPGPWQKHDDPAKYYYLIDFEENQPSSSMRQPGESETIWWFGFPRDGLPQDPSEIPAAHRYSPPGASDAPQREDPVEPSIEPRRYGNPL
jgi:hypothetical protein